jgi:monovalent cation/hydrogen antiporter
LDLFILILLLLIGAVFLTRLATAISVPYPSMLALGGALVGLIPGIPSFTLDPALALVIFVAPVLIAAAYDISLRDLRDNRIPIITLVLVAVGLTTVAVAVVFHSLVPLAPWPAAVALGAIVAPPDAAAATAVLRQVNIPRRLVLILEGESLFNDASALLIFAVALRLTMDGDGSVFALVSLYGLSIVASVFVGLGLGWLYPKAVMIVEDQAGRIVLQFCAAYGIWVLAEKLDLSPILTTVAYAIGLAKLGYAAGTPSLRVQSYSVWETVVFLTNVLAFTLIGFQLAPVLARLTPSERNDYFFIAAVVLATVILVRIAWVTTFNAALRLKNQRFGFDLPKRIMRPTARGGFVIAWCGMRGIVTLAAALALPAGFPERDLVQFCSFVVVLGTLLLQGLTLGPLIRFLNMPQDTQIDIETAIAKKAALRAGLASLQREDSKYAVALRIELEAGLGGKDAAGADALTMSGHDRLRVRSVAASREAIAELFREGQIGKDAYLRVQAALDRSELHASRYSA